jgi:hypothetical protein
MMAWRWNDLASTENLCDYLPIAQQGGNRIVRIHQNRGMDGILDWFRQDTAQCSPEYTPEYLLLLHQSAFSESDFLRAHYAASVSPVSCKVEHFGGGNSFVYYRPSTGTGFIDQSGNLADVFDKTANIRNEQGALHYHLFHNTWRHYQYQAKQGLYKSKVFTQRCLGALEPERIHGTAFQLLSDYRPELMASLKETFGLLYEHYHDEPEVILQTDHIVDILTNRPLSSHEDLHEINTCFDCLLCAIKENIH